jgi:hypothetical protein
MPSDLLNWKRATLVAHLVVIDPRCDTSRATGSCTVEQEQVAKLRASARQVLMLSLQLRSGGLALRHALSRDADSRYLVHSHDRQGVVQPLWDSRI